LKEEKKKKWDDYGEICVDQLDKAFTELKDKVNISEYRILVAFHHHFYPFPEIYKSFGDKSMMRNFWEVSKFLSQNNTQIVLHGHKHVSIKRPVATEKYFSDSNSMMYVFSAGSLGCTGTNMNYQVLEVYSPTSYTIAKLSKYEYNLEQLNEVKPDYIPPKQNFEKATLEILELLKRERQDLYDKYTSISNNNISESYQINRIIENVSMSITQFEDVRNRLKKNPELIFLILIATHYRIVAIDQLRENKNHSAIIDKIVNLFKSIQITDKYENDIIKLLSSNNNAEFLNNYKKLESKYSKKSLGKKIEISFITVAIYFTDIFISLGKYGEFYYENEGIDHKINIKLSDETQFKDHLPLSTISIKSDNERRCANISFECSDPTVHRVAVLVLKDFENRINTIEDSFKEIGLKIYYIRPIISTKDSDCKLENLNFEAYIPTLLPLLTGENLYKSREVFIRELIQNSMDAILLRYEIEKEKKKNGKSNNIDFDKTIYINMGINKNVKGQNRNFVKIKDFGVGMDKYKIERYFTSIGRSFYVSKEFKELQNEQSISYKPVSNFGIGFLSAFMVCKEINVLTKSIETTNSAYEIEIPNYDGCFFVKEASTFHDFGTEITLFDEVDKSSTRKIDFQKIRKYIEETICDIQLDIKLVIQSEEKIIESFAYRKQQQDTPMLFIPFKENGIENLNYNNILNRSFESEHPFGLSILFPNKCRGKVIELNEGIRLTKTSDTSIRNYELCDLAYNYPSSYIQLDVAREEIKEFKNKEKDFLKDDKFNKAINKEISKQSLSLIQHIIKKKRDQKLSLLNRIYNFSYNNQFSRASFEKIEKKIYILEVDLNKSPFEFSLIPYSNEHFKDPNILQITPNIHKSLYYFIKKMNSFLSSEIKKSEVVDEIKKKLESRFDELEKISEKIIGNKFEGLGHRFDKLGYRFEKELGYSFEKELGIHFEDEFGYKIETIFEHNFEEAEFKFEKKLKHLLVDLDDMFENEIEYILDSLDNKFENEFNNLFEEESRQQFIDEFVHMFKGFNLINNSKLCEILSCITSMSRSRKKNKSIYWYFIFFMQVYHTICHLVSIEDLTIAKKIKNNY